MRSTLFLLLISLAMAEPTNYEKYCEVNPLEPRCYSEAIGGTNTLRKERRREIRDEHKYDFDDRQYPSQDLDDPRESL